MKTFAWDLCWYILALYMIFLSLHGLYMVVLPLGLIPLSSLSRGTAGLPLHQRQECLKKTVPGKPLLTHTANVSLASGWSGSVLVWEERIAKLKVN